MKFEIGNIYHVYNRGNNHEALFLRDEDYHQFLKYTRKFILPSSDILCWCLMPNHFHFLLHANETTIRERKAGGLLLQELTYGIKQLLSCYSKSFNLRNQRTGNLFQQKTKSKNISEGFNNYSADAFYYILQNPWAAGLVNKIEDWPYSSYHEYAGSIKDPVISKAKAMQLLDIDFNRFELEVYQRISSGKEKLLL